MSVDEHIGHRTASFYPSIQPYDSGMLDVGDGHSVYWEVCGNPDGKPALFLHGGPGGGCHPDYRRLFDPLTYKIVLFDQRGCGRSTPHAAIEANTTQHLVDDIERLRLLLKVDNWLILGGSWGVALALAYAQQHREHVRALVLRGAFTARQLEFDWLYKHGASSMFPEGWERFIAPIPEAERDDLITAYHRRLVGDDTVVRLEAARTWCSWEGELLTLKPRTPRTGPATRGEIALSRIEAHYFVHKAFLSEGQLIANMGKIADIPGVIVQGRYDVVTPPRTALELHKAWPKSLLHIVPDAGHATSEPGILAALVEATDSFRSL
ncbi:prolyl aminopeptidase [Methylocella sp. CPCC 101449]|uniref:prolyl aminopeptidase n=1 Tax=Methylocella sp. CPCC 101449 TaxID=2987531 RepID=UPI00288D9CC7|nr:prolyl aminopeptidase [Methylocella sp. CPCC 101449]MDT2019485.1 prolyl aminopeptidase [Methylocella sp. CPCC 101449]